MVMKFYLDSIARPARSGEYYVITEAGRHCLINYSAKRQAWNVRDDADLYDPNNEINVCCWAYKPKTYEVLKELEKEN